MYMRHPPRFEQVKQLSYNLTRLYLQQETFLAQKSKTLPLGISIPRHVRSVSRLSSVYLVKPSHACRWANTSDAARHPSSKYPPSSIPQPSLPLTISPCRQPVSAHAATSVAPSGISPCFFLENRHPFPSSVQAVLPILSSFSLPIFFAECLQVFRSFLSSNTTAVLVRQQQSQRTSSQYR